ncbi:MAG: protoporphyrinogen oxidase [Candidatus Bathyarchaeia archaeon]
MDALVIGAGISGLSTAYALHRRGLKVKLLEASSRVGGVIRSERKSGYLLEYGPNSLIASVPTAELIEELGLQQQVVESDGRAPRYIYADGRLQRVGPQVLFSGSLLSLRGRLRLLAEPFIRSRAATADESVEAFVVRRLGREVHDRLFSPFVTGVYAGNTALMSVAACFPQLVALEAEYGSIVYGALRSRMRTQKRVKRSLYSFKDGLSALPSAIAARLGDAIELSRPAEHLEVSASSPRYRVVTAGREYSSDRLILTLPAPEAARLLEASLPELAKELRHIEYVSLGVVYLSYDLAELGRDLHGFGFLIPRSEGLETLGAIWSSSLFPNRAPAGKALLTCFIGGAHNPKAATLSDKELSGKVSAELSHILETSAHPEIVDVWKMARAIPQYTLGHSDRLRRISRMLENTPGLTLAGNYLQGVSVPDCIDRGLKTASSL